MKDNENFVNTLIEDAENVNENPINNENIEKEIDTLNKNLEILGISYNDEENKKAILDYAIAINHFRDLLSKQKNHYEALKSYENGDETALTHIDNLDKNWNEISKYFESLMSFFINPPSKDMFDLINYSALLKNVYSSFKEYFSKFNQLRINDQIEINKKRYEEHLQEIDNFYNSVSGKLENTVKVYDDFLNNFVKKQEQKLEEFNKKSSDLAKGYDDFLNKNLKFFKGGVYGLVFLNIALAICLGALVATSIFKYQELNEIVKISNQLDNVGIIKNENSLVFEFPASANLVEENNTKKIILK